MTDRLKRVLLVAHDRGGVNLLAPLLWHWRRPGSPIMTEFISTPMIQLEVAGMTGTASSPAPLVKLGGSGDAYLGRTAWSVDEEGLLRVLARGWDLVLTGTSAVSTMEKTVWRLCRQHSIPVVAICDMWTEYRRRVTDEAGAMLIDHLLVIDDRMAEEVRGEMGASFRTGVVGNPHFARLLSNRRVDGVERVNLRFISEPIGALFPNAGTHEFHVADMVIQALEGLPGAMPLLLRPHPQDDSEGWRRFAHRYRAKNVRLDDAPSWACQQSTKMAIGLSSMMLIELAIAGVPVASIQPPGSDSKYFCLQETEFGIEILRGVDDLAAWMRAPGQPKVSADFVRRHSKAIEDITDLIVHDRLLA